MSKLSETIKPVTARLFGNDLLELQKLMLIWKEELEDLSIAESEVLNAAVLRILNMAVPERRAAEIARMELSEQQAKDFIRWCELGVKAFLVDLKTNMERRDALDGRKKSK